MNPRVVVADTPRGRDPNSSAHLSKKRRRRMGRLRLRVRRVDYLAAAQHSVGCLTGR